MGSVKADTIDLNVSSADTSDGLKIKMIEAYTKSTTPEWSKPERFIVTPSELSSDYTASEFKQFMESYRDTSKEPAITEKQAETIMKYLRENEYAAFVDRKGNLKVADFSEDFNLDEAAGGEIYKTKDLVELTSDLISKDDGFSDDYEKDMRCLRPLFDYYIKPKAFQTEISLEKQQNLTPRQLYDSFIGKVEKEFRELKFLRAAAASVIRTLTPEEKQVINGELKKRGARSPETLAMVVRNSIEKRHKGKDRLPGKDCSERER